MTEKSFDTIVSVLIDSKIIAMKFNEDGINDNYIENINSALSELKEIKNNGFVFFTHYPAIKIYILHLF